MGTEIFMPIASKTSALPQLEDIALFPCLATLIPNELTTNPTAVDILNLFKPEPPVPQVSIICWVLSFKSKNASPKTFSLLALSLITMAAAKISSSTSPFIFNDVKNAAICEKVD